MSSFMRSIFLVWPILYSYAAFGPVTELFVANKIIEPDGFSRAAVLAGDVFPGPLIYGKKGDNFQINVTNALTDNDMDRSTSIHYHGIFQNQTNYADGVSFVTQCPIVPNHSFTYNFTVLNQAGTFWYHSHLSAQYCDGLRGPLVIYDPHDPHAHLYDIDDESTVLTLSDWYHIPSPLAGLFPLPDSNLINGLGRYDGGPLSELAIINVQYGKRYRMRLISMACHPNYVFTIDSHSFIIIEADGVSTEPLVVDSIQIFSAQRYSFVLTADQAVDNYWVRAKPNQGNTTFLGGLNSAILRYKGADDTEPISATAMSVAPLVETDLHPLESPGAPGIPEMGGADVLLNLNLRYTPKTNFTVNDVSFVPPSVPVLLQILSGARDAAELLPSGSVYLLPPNKVIELSLPGGALPGSPHPFHLHGHTFDVVRSVGNSTYNYANPVRRDTVNTGGLIDGDNVTVRFVTDNSGPWFFHCHIDWHLNTGLAILFAEDTAGTASHSPVTKPWQDLCPIYHDTQLSS